MRRDKFHVREVANCLMDGPIYASHQQCGPHEPSVVRGSRFAVRYMPPPLRGVFVYVRTQQEDSRARRPCLYFAVRPFLIDLSKWPEGESKALSCSRPESSHAACCCSRLRERIGTRPATSIVPPSCGYSNWFFGSCPRTEQLQRAVSF